MLEVERCLLLKAFRFCQTRPVTLKPDSFLVKIVPEPKQTIYLKSQCLILFPLSQLLALFARNLSMEHSISNSTHIRNCLWGPGKNIIHSIFCTHILNGQNIRFLSAIFILILLLCPVGYAILNLQALHISLIFVFVGTSLHIETLNIIIQ